LISVPKNRRLVGLVMFVLSFIWFSWFFNAQKNLNKNNRNDDGIKIN
jgi:hypothetical protein